MADENVEVGDEGAEFLPDILQKPDAQAEVRITERAWPRPPYGLPGFTDVRTRTIASNDSLSTSTVVSGSGRMAGF